MSESKIYKIPSDNMDVLARKFKKLGRRAKRIGLPTATYTELKVEHKKLKDGRIILLHHITVDAGITSVKVDGWEFVAVVQHTEEGNILRNISDQEIPEKYRNTSNYCDHCKVQRNRKDTYILRKVV